MFLNRLSRDGSLSSALSPVTAARNLEIFLVIIALEERLRRVIEELVEWKLLVNYGGQFGLLAHALPLLDPDFEAIPPRRYLIHEEVSRRLTGIRDVALHVQRFL